LGIACLCAGAWSLSGCSRGKNAKLAQAEETGRWHKVRYGDTLVRIAERYGRRVEVICKANNLGNPAYLYDGLELWIPPTDRLDALSGAAALGDAPRNILAASALSFGSNPRNSQSSSQVAMATKKLDPDFFDSAIDRLRGLTSVRPRTADLNAVSRAPDADQKRFSWPLPAPVIRPEAIQETNMGIDLAAQPGTPVLAARDGIVLYSDELRGFGKMVLIDHGDGFHSVYTHNAANTVSKDQMVKQGQEIARVGSTGNADKPKLHFEIRQSTTAVPPLKYLPKL